MYNKGLFLKTINTNTFCDTPLTLPEQVVVRLINGLVESIKLCSPSLFKTHLKRFVRATSF